MELRSGFSWHGEGELWLGRIAMLSLTPRQFAVLYVLASHALTLAGNGNIVVDGIAAESLEVDLPGNGTLTGSGTATRLQVTVSGSGVARFTELVANKVQASVSGSGSIFLTATKSLRASVSGSGAILYTGDPQDVTRSITGSGGITEG